MTGSLRNYPIGFVVFTHHKVLLGGRDGVVSIVTHYRLHDSVFEARWDKRFSLLHNHPEGPWGSLSLLYNGYPKSLCGEKPLGRDVDHPPPSGADVKNG